MKRLWKKEGKAWSEGKQTQDSATLILSHLCEKTELSAKLDVMPPAKP